MFRRASWAWLLLLVPLVLTIAWTGLNHDVRFVLGTLQTAGRAGLAPSEVFVHRPMAYRLVLAAGDAGSALPLPVREAVVRILALVAVLLLSLLLRAGLRRYRPAREATVVAAATGVAPALAPNWDFLQPEWLAAVFATGGVGAALRIPRLVPPPWPVGCSSPSPCWSSTRQRRPRWSRWVSSRCSTGGARCSPVCSACRSASGCSG
ncbi:hypothetical protein [Amycolatopsis sp.]|uniref:hypothetical protein n=1 Tax=Amycolatopsis sp. TaxID=37632 RepID=UPI002D7FF216|nr:hypothetical protein [Amycolatopsis sp.]HET6705894.1 hypothetical protein [Amycolatopsis sp.]